MSKQTLKIKRMGTLVSVLSKHGFNDILGRIGWGSDPIEHPGQSPEPGVSMYARIRMAMEELGPTFVKLGQALSNREDILPAEMIRQLEQLQDRVELADMDIHAVLRENFGPDYAGLFHQIDPTPVASASIAQVYRAELVTGERVVLKVKRPGIDVVIEADLLLMKDLARLLTRYFDFADDINLEQAVRTFEKSLLNELSMVHERENMERFAHNFKGDALIYVPRVYPHVCTNEVLCMEFIDGAKITDAGFYPKNNLSPAQTVERGLQLYLRQILDHGFFHADPHAGNIMLLPDGRIVFIDLGAMGVIYPADQELLEDLILYLITKNVPQLVVILKKMAVRMEIRDETKVHNDIAEIMDMVNTSSLERIDITFLLQKFKDILFENRVVMPDYFTLLARGLVLIESVGRTLNPGMNLIKSVEPYVYRIIRKRLHPRYLMHKLSDIGLDLQHFPAELRSIVRQLSSGNLKIQSDVRHLEPTNNAIKNGFREVAMAIVFGATLLASMLVMVMGMGPQWNGIPVLAGWGFLLSGGLALALVLSWVRK
jgi:ubiquinone biosynthesis protein